VYVPYDGFICLDLRGVSSLIVKYVIKVNGFKETVWEVLRVYSLRLAFSEIKASKGLKDLRELNHPYRYDRANESGYMVGAVVTHDSDYFPAVAYRQID
jgi:hypothetical protein